MLVNLTPDLDEIERRRQIAKEHNFEYIPQSDPQWQEDNFGIGIYQSSFPYNFPKEEFLEKLDDTYEYNQKKFEKNKKEGESLLQYYSRKTNPWVHTYGVADNVEQIKEFYKKQIKSKREKFVIAITPVWQEKENRGKGGGWRWHKWGEYIGKLKPQCEYLDDEDFGADFKYVLTFSLYHVSDKA